MKQANLTDLISENLEAGTNCFKHKPYAIGHNKQTHHIRGLSAFSLSPDLSHKKTY